MTWLAFKLFIGGLFKRLWKALGAGFKWCLGHPKDAAIVALVCLSVWLWRGKERAQDTRDAALVELAKVIDAGKRAHAEQVALNQSIQKRYEQGAKDADAKFHEGLRRSGDAAADYARTHRVQQVCRGQASSGNPPTAPNHPRVPEAAPGSAELVAIAEHDLMVCTTNHEYAKAAYEWAKSLETAGTGESLTR